MPERPGAQRRSQCVVICATSPLLFNWATSPLLLQLDDFNLKFKVVFTLFV